MSKLIFTLSALILFSGCATPEEIKIIEEEKRKTAIVIEEIEKNIDEKKKTNDRFFCEGLCRSSWDGNIGMVCTINCVNAIKSGEIL